MKKSKLLPSLAFCRTPSNDVCPRLIKHRQHVMGTMLLQEPWSVSLFADVGTNGEHSAGESNSQDPSKFFELMSPATSAKPDQMSASSLAYLGDVVFELFVRSRYVWPSRRMSDLQNKVVSVVRAEAQSLLLQKFIESFPLTSTEQGVLARGRNANLTARKKGKGASSGGVSAYQDSTAFEALLGYTFISDKDRLNEMISWMKTELDELDGL